MKTHKVLSVSLAALLIAAAGNLSAQTAASPTSESTFGRFRSAADDFIRTDSYTAVKQEKWFGFASWASSSAVLGYAQKIGDLYVAINYNGTAWGNVWSNAADEKDSNFFGAYKPWKVYNTLEFPQTTGANPTTITPNNNIGILIGAADMGFRLFFTSTLQSFKDSDFTVTTAGAAGSAAAGTYKSFEKGYGNITPQLEWAMTKGLIAAGIQPKVQLQLQFHRDYEKMETYNALPANTTQGEQVRLSANYLQPRLQAGLGGFTLYNENGFKASVDLDYELNLRLYDNEFSYLNTTTGKYVTEKIKGLYSTAAGTNYTENTWMKNTITPSLSAQWSSEDKRISLKSKLNLFFNLENSAATTMSFDLSDNYKIKKDGNDTTTSSFTFYPRFDVAAQYQIIPKRLTLNAGGRIQVSEIGAKTTETKTYSNGTETPNTASKTTAPFFGIGTSTSLKAGAVWNMTDNVWLEGATGISTSQGVGAVELLGNVVEFTSILAGLKF